MRLLSGFFLAICLIGTAAHTQDNPLAPGWTLVAKSSKLQFQSVKNMSKVETSSFASYNGHIDPDGRAIITVQLDSVDTKIDLRNVRMRFLLFETFLHPEAFVNLTINAADFSALATARRQTFAVSFELDLHGVKQQMQTDVVATLITNDMVSVASTAPVLVAFDQFNLMDGMQKLQEAANVTITPSGLVSFDFVFQRDGDGTAVVAEIAPAETALEAEGNFDQEACLGRFEILSRANAIYFSSGSARLSNDSAPLLDSMIEIINRCPGIHVVVEGHTDSIGSDALNQNLSEARAASVMTYLAGAGIAADRLTSIGYGESRPVASNDNSHDRSRNRRIQFSSDQ